MKRKQVINGQTGAPNNILGELRNNYYTWTRHNKGQSERVGAWTALPQ